MNTYRIGWGIPSARHPRDAMHARLTTEGECQRVWLAGDKQPSGRAVTRSWMLRDVREGTVVVVTDGRFLLAEGDGTPRRRLFAGLREIADRGGSAEIIGGEMHTRDPDARDALIEATLDSVAKSHSGADAGRPPKPLLPDELSWIEPTWRDLRVPTDAAARDKIVAEAARRGARKWVQKMSKRQINARLGASGRSALRRTKVKAK